jgi:hypothetical protein
MWTYEQATGRLIGPEGTTQGVGYSGQPPHKNVPEDEGLEGLGPIPCGCWIVTGVEDSPTLGEFVLILTPDAATRARVLALGRNPDTFRMHGERLAPPAGFASDGCIIQIKAVRQMVFGSADKQINVVKGITQ